MYIGVRRDLYKLVLKQSNTTTIRAYSIYANQCLVSQSESEINIPLQQRMEARWTKCGD